MECEIRTSYSRGLLEPSSCLKQLLLFGFCSVDLQAQQIITFLDGQPLSPIRLQDFRFSVIGTNFEEWDKAFSFWDFSNAENFCGMADNLKVYRRALTPSEMSVLSSANLVVERANGDIVVHWPASSTGYSLDFTDSLSPNPSWAPYTGKTLPIGDRQLAVFFAPHDAAFFRLRRSSDVPFAQDQRPEVYPKRLISEFIKPLDREEGGNAGGMNCWESSELDRKEWGSPPSIDMLR